MDFEAEDVRQYLRGVDYPANKEQLISTAEDNDAPDELLDRIGTLARPQYNEEEDVIAELRAAPGAG